MTTANASPAHDVTDLGLAAEGVRRIEWAEREMPVLRLIRERFERDRPLDGLRIGACLHVTTETANLMRTLKAGGADVVLAASNPLSTKDDVAAALVAEYGIAVHARRGEDRDTYYAHLNAVADTHPQLTMDDGCDLTSLLHTSRPAQVNRGPGGHRGDDDRRDPPPRDGRRWRPGLPRDRGQRGPDQAPLRQPLRHRPEHARRHPPGDEHPDRRSQGRRRRLRLGGQGDRRPDGRPRRPRDDHRSTRSVPSRR
jgi:adenosylhomocysteinase